MYGPRIRNRPEPSTEQYSFGVSILGELHMLSFPESIKATEKVALQNDTIDIQRSIGLGYYGVLIFAKPGWFRSWTYRT